MGLPFVLDKRVHKPHCMVTSRKRCAQGAKADSTGPACLRGYGPIAENRSTVMCGARLTWKRPHRSVVVFTLMVLTWQSSLGMMVVVSKLQGETGAGLSPRSAPTSRRLRCTFIFHLCIHLDASAHATTVLLDLAEGPSGIGGERWTCTW
jgi:hypothetical protein